MNFKQPIPSTLKIVTEFGSKGYFKFGDHTIIAFYPVKSAKYDLSFGNKQKEALKSLTSSQITIVVYDKNSNYITSLNHNNISEMFEFNKTAILIGPDNKFYYFDLNTNKFILKNFIYPFSSGRGKTFLNEVTEDVVILTHDYYAIPTQTELNDAYKALVDEYNTKATKKVGYLTAPSFPGLTHFAVDIMINTNFEVEDLQMYWYAPMSSFGFTKYFSENKTLNISKVLVPKNN